MNNTVNFEVVKIYKANKPGCVVVDLVFNESNKPYTYVRKDYGNSTYIDGCKIEFDDNYKVVSIERVYETKGRKRTDTSKASKKISDSIKDELKEKEIKTEVKAVKVDDGEVYHEKFDSILTCVSNNIPVYLVGPAGSGKNHTLEQVAKKLGLDFYFTNSIQQEYKLTGFIDAGGNYHETEFYKAFTNGGLFFLDEMDASIPEVLVLLNAAIANGYFEFPNGKVNANKNFRVVAAGNTVGNGADEQYTGRMVLDQATLDRFAVIEFGYSKKIEVVLAKGNLELVDFIHKMRDEAELKGIRATFSYRCITMVVKLEGVLELDEVLKIAVFKGFDKDTINTFNAAGNGKYEVATRKLQKAA